MSLAHQPPDCFRFTQPPRPLHRKCHGVFFQCGKRIVPHNNVMDSRAAKRWFISGSVQGVGFRYFVLEKATSLGLTGWARNLSDGRVEVYATGPASRLNDLAAALHMGPRGAHVRTVEERGDKVENLSSFSIR